MQTSQKGDNLDTLFGIDVQYQVPRYQRRYVWNQANWLTLWEDTLLLLGLEIDEANGGIVDVQSEQNRVTALSSLEDKHFTGPFVTRPIGGSGTLDRFEVIDGQQRLTTFQIILCIIRDICKSQGHNELAEEAGGNIVNKGTVIRRNTSESFPDPTYKFLPTEYDKPAFEKIAVGEYGDAIRKIEAFDEQTRSLLSDRMAVVRSEVFVKSEEISDNILKTYEYFYEQIRIYVGEACDFDKIDTLLSSIKYRFELIQITLDSSDQSEKIFESLNATGRKLSEFDYLRNDLFLRAGKLGLHKESGKPYSERFYTQYWHFENHHRYWDADRLESFFKVFLAAKLGPFCFQPDDENEKDKKAFEVYQKLYQRQIKNDGIEHEFDELNRYSKFYKKVHPGDINEYRSDSIGLRIQFYEDLKIPSLFPFLLHLKNEKKVSEQVLDQVCHILESYIVRRMVNSGYGPRNEDNEAYRFVNQFFSQLVKEEVFSLKRFVASIPGWPNNSAILGGRRNKGHVTVGGLQRTANDTHYENRDLTRNLAWSLLSYIFYRIERYITQDNTLLFANFSTRYEHYTRILPEPQNRANRRAWVGIGNLTFRANNRMSTSRVNNLPFEETKEILRQPPNKDLKLNQVICAQDDWDIKRILIRQKELSNQFCSIWPDRNSFLEQIR